MSSVATFDDMSERVMAFMKARKWDEVNTPRGLAISLSLEANELLEYFQWSEESYGSAEDMASELADIFIYALHFAHKFDIDVPTAIEKKLAEQAKKYPAEIFTIEDEAEKNKRWLEAKQNFKKTTTL